MKNNSLVLVGSGIKFLAHLTVEAKVYIEQAQKLLYLVNDPFLKEWLQEANNSCESLDELYQSRALRLECYQAITDYILYTVRSGIHTCVVLYGHPTVFAKPGLDAIKKARKEGYDTRILPGISAEACLFADLMIDPSSSGCQSFEATDFLIRPKKFDTSCHLILWQADIIGALNNPNTFDNTIGLKLLIEKLSALYHPSHHVILYEAAQYPGFESKIEPTTIKELEKKTISSITSLYIPPINIAATEQNILKALHLSA